MSKDSSTGDIARNINSIPPVFIPYGKSEQAIVLTFEKRSEPIVLVILKKAVLLTARTFTSRLISAMSEKREVGGFY
jgi:hypothetical protein